ncbi:MAG: hypothetical protein ABIE74_06485 [Pseudomonadota bacterium]
MILFIAISFLFPKSVIVLFGQTANDSQVEMGATVNPTIQITLSGGSNQFGKSTILTGDAVDFGNVAFTHPELVSNGDAFLNDKGNLVLEAVLNVAIIFSGIDSVGVELTRLYASPSSFSNSYYSLSTNRSDIGDVIYTYPQFNRVDVLSGANTITLRMLLEISPQQSGKITDRFRLTTSAI